MFLPLRFLIVYLIGIVSILERLAKQASELWTAKQSHKNRSTAHHIYHNLSAKTQRSKPSHTDLAPDMYSC